MCEELWKGKSCNKRAHKLSELQVQVQFLEDRWDSLLSRQHSYLPITVHQYRSRLETIFRPLWSVYHHLHLFPISAENTGLNQGPRFRRLEIWTVSLTYLSRLINLVSKENGQSGTSSFQWLEPWDNWRFEELHLEFFTFFDQIFAVFSKLYSQTFSRLKWISRLRIMSSTKCSRSIKWFILIMTHFDFFNDSDIYKLW